MMSRAPFQAFPGESEEQARDRMRAQRIAEGRTDLLLTDEERGYFRHLDALDDMRKTNPKI